MLVFKATIDCGVRTLEREVNVRAVQDDSARVLSK